MFNNAKMVNFYKICILGRCWKYYFYIRLLRKVDRQETILKNPSLFRQVSLEINAGFPSIRFLSLLFYC